ncbi:hypothetical protein EMCRGX_G030609 [Ephydatia muelleri]|eukprot:Em0010g858a
MATTTQAEDIEPTPAAPPAGPKKHADVETQGLEKVTDYVEEQEIGELTEAISNIDKVLVKEKEAKAQRELELAKVTIKKEEVDLIVGELEISRTAAEKILREHKGDLIKALHILTD